MGVIDDWYTDGRVLSVRLSVIISLTDFIPVIDGISPSVKLFNGVVSLMTNRYLSIVFGRVFVKEALSKFIYKKFQGYFT
jgi:hypothetical protein